ncbi:MAG: hypothetical protein K5662_04305 [Lachnospiraceae bacterium]|nr:hypothetical protein [Lachnospiraceae bacterium]
MDHKRLTELADRSYNGGIYTFTDFCDMAVISEFYSHEREFDHVHPKLYGGYEMAERRMIRFGDEEELGYEVDFPIKSLAIKPLKAEFADELSHRDYLGALMNLGIRREMIGDIFVRDRVALVFCKDSIADYIIDNLRRVRHTSVSVSIEENISELTGPRLTEKIIQVTSARVDAVISRVFNISRQESLNLFPVGNVYLNGRICTENAKALKTGDIVSARGYGKFEFMEEIGESRKGKLNCRIGVYS